MRYWLFALIISSMFLAGCEKKPQVLELSKQTLDKDTTWSGTVIINGDIYVPPGVTLTIEPGTTIKFKRIDETSDQNMFGLISPYYPEAEIIIRGKIIAKGTKKQAIVFTSNEIDARPKDWGAINLLGSDGNVFEYCKLLFGYNGIHGHGSEAVITNCEFAKNGVGVSFKMEEETKEAPWFGKISKMKISHNKFLKNKGGIGFRNSIGEITHNLIEDNKFFGVFPKEKADAVISYNQITGNKKGVYLYQAQKVKIEHNNIYDNRDYNIAVAEAQDFDVSAQNNWFGTINPESIEEMIFDKKDDADLGEVLYVPFLKKRVSWER